MIKFAEPIWLVLGILLIVGLFFMYRKMQSLRTIELERFAASHLLGKLCRNVSSQRRTVKKILILVAIGACFLALARPQYGFKWIEVKRKGIDILFAVDTSKSMLAEDVRPNRLKRAKFAILDFVSQLEGDRVGLMPFAGTAFLMCPLTIDYGAFETSLQAINTTIIPRGGTDLAAAITEAEAVLSNEANHKILVLITDGENLEGDALQAAQTAAEKGMMIYTVGVGTRDGELIPLTSNGKTGFVKDEAGRFITSQLDETALTKIAEMADGLYVPLGAKGEGLQTIYQEKLSLIPKEELAEKRHKVALERFVWPIGAAIVFLVLEFLISGRKSRFAFRIPFIKTAGRRRKKAAALLFLFSLLPGVQSAEASAGEDAYSKGDFLTASQFYDEELKKFPDDPRLHYNYGTAAYKNNMFEDATQSFSEALKSDDLALQEEAYYNRGNSLFQRGNETLQTDPQHTMEMWQQAIDSFDGALQLNSVNEDAGYNMELVKRKLEELKKQQEQQEQEQQEQENKEEGEEPQGEQDQQDKEQDSSGQDQENSEGQQDQKKQDEGGGQEKESDQPEQGADGQEEPQQEDAAAAEKDKAQAEQQDSEEQAASEQQARAEDQERREQGKMTREEARQLLNSLKDEEGELNFIPSSATEQAKEHALKKDW